MTGRFRVVTVALAMALLVGFGGGLARPLSAAAAAPTVAVSVTGSYSVYSWQGTSWRITLKNTNSFAVQHVHVDIHDEPVLPIDYHGISATINGRAIGSCRIIVGNTVFGYPEAACDFDSIAAGQSVVIKLTGGTTVVVGRGIGDLYAAATTNYPANQSVSSAVQYPIAYHY